MHRHPVVHWTPRIAILAMICGAGLAMMANPAAAASSVATDVRAGVFTDANAVAVGAGVLAPMGSDHRWYFNPNLEVGFGDRQKLIAVNGDVHYDVSHSSDVAVWMGGGPTVLVTDPSRGDSRTDVGLNVLTGLGGTHGQVRPFAQIKGVMADNSQVVLQGGVRF